MAGSIQRLTETHPGVNVSEQNLDQLCINTIRTLSIDAVQQANSGHPGAPMGLAPVAYCLWQYFLNYDPASRIGRIATVLCFPMAMLRCCCTPCSIWRA